MLPARLGVWQPGVLYCTGAPPFFTPCVCTSQRWINWVSLIRGEVIANTVQMLLQANPWQQQTHNFLNTNDIIILLYLQLAAKGPVNFKVV